MDGWEGGWAGRWVDGWVEGGMEGWREEWTDGWTDGWTNRWVDGWRDRETGNRDEQGDRQTLKIKKGGWCATVRGGMNCGELRNSCPA